MKKSNMGLIIVIAIVVLIGIIIMSSYNGIVSLSEDVDSKYATIDTYLQRRADLIPNLVSTVKGYTQHEEKIINSITEAREKMTSAKTVTEKAEANDELTTALNNLMVVVENYPDLKASQNFIQLSDELAGTENRIATERNRYNESVQTFNAKIRKFPTSFIASIMGVEKRDYFEAQAGADQAPSVNF